MYGYLEIFAIDVSMYLWDLQHNANTLVVINVYRGTCTYTWTIIYGAYTHGCTPTHPHTSTNTCTILPARTAHSEVCAYLMLGAATLCESWQPRRYLSSAAAVRATAGKCWHKHRVFWNRAHKHIRTYTHHTHTRSVFNVQNSTPFHCSPSSFTRHSQSILHILQSITPQRRVYDEGTAGDQCRCYWARHCTHRCYQPNITSSATVHVACASRHCFNSGPQIVK